MRSLHSVRKTNHKNACTVYVQGSKEICWGPREEGDSHMKMDGIFVASLRIDHDGNQYDMFTIEVNYCGLWVKK